MECVPTVAITSMWPSGGALATASAPMLPPAPGLLSTTTGWPRLAFSEKVRARMSGAPPGGKVTTRRMGWRGKACWARACGAMRVVVAAAKAAKAAKVASARRGVRTAGAEAEAGQLRVNSGMELVSW